ncbi:unnamed protein product [Urochloa decumbens]|uniref:Rx N-terminal domain-containing protein n=1 Tax=Urochloa decumbens TaxID=240449 RepID=A0ABC9CAB6_9POAL
MAEQIVSSATSAVTGELAKILFSGLVGRLDNRQAAAAAANKKLRRLELLLIKFHSAVEASEKHPIENAWLLKWRDTLKVAAAEGDEVLAGFRQRQRASNSMGAAQGQVPGDDDAHRQQEQQDRPSSSSSATASAAPPSGLAQGTRGATKARLFSSDEDMERLNSAVERLEELSPEIGTFLKLLKLEILTPPEPSTESTERIIVAKRKRPSASSGNRSQRGRGRSTGPFICSLDAEAGFGALLLAPNMNKKEGPEESCRKTPMDQTVEATQDEEERSTLVDRLEEAFATICKTVELADGRDLSDHKWLAYWASILREAKSQGRPVLANMNARRCAGGGEDEEVARCDDQDSELGRFVCGMESLAGEADYFAGLACLCASY